MAMSCITDYGKAIKKRLIDINQSQEWLISQVRAETNGLYLDSSYLHKIISGQRKAPKIVAAINQILELKPANDEQEIA